jgi:hypothetical protein
MKWYRQWPIAALLIAAIVSPAYAQSGTSSITGNVTDSSGGVIPGATVVATDASGAKFQSVTNSQGAYSIPALSAGTYKVTVTLQGFKTVNVDNVRVVSGNPAAVNVKLEIGAISEIVEVKSSTELINTQTATVSATLNADQLNRMPTTSRNALNAVTFLPGVNTATTNRNSTINGLPESMLNITLDGVSNQDNFNKSTDGFFASVYPRQDAVESVTVTSAVGGANLGGSGGVTIAFTTRSGTNQMSGSAYEYYRRPELNSNNWLNERNGLPRNETKLDQYGARLGGPIRLPGLYDGRGKAFFFFHYEELRFPNNFTKTRTIMNPATLDGTFIYGSTANPTVVNVMAIAANQNNAQITSTFDPQVLNVLNLIRASTLTTGVINERDLMTKSYVYQSPAELLERQPTGRVDVNVTQNHRLSVSASSLWARRDPDYLNDDEPRFPGAPNYTLFASTRPLYSMTLRSTLSSNLVNELKGGLTAVGSAGSRFGQPSDPSMSAAAFADQGGYALALPFSTNWWEARAASWRAAPTYNIENSLNWQHGNHSLNFGGSWLRSSAWENAQQIVSQVTLGFVNATCPGGNPCDPASGMFNTTNFPGASNNDLNNARAHYAQLTGRISQISGQVALDPNTNQYVPQGPRRREGYVNVISGFAQDSWRMTPTLTLSAGLRYDLQTPFVVVNDTMSAVKFDSVCGQSGLGAATTAYNKCNFFGHANTGLVPEYIKFSKNSMGYNTDYNNVAPSVSLAWRPNVQTGFMRTILGDPEQATLRGGYSVSYERQGIGAITGVFGGNPGSTLTINRNSGNGNLVNGVETWPLMYSQKDRLYPAAFPATVSYPIAIQADRASTLNAFAPDVEVASARSWTIGLQRAISKDMAVEVRYVGTRGVDQWSALNYNTRDIVENGFMNEFKQAVTNLRVNNASGDNTRIGSFKYAGPGTGTSPLPIYFAYIVGGGDPSNQAAYSSTTWTNTAFTGDMIFVNPSPANSAADLDGSVTQRANAIAAGLPANYFVVNPAVSGNSVTDSGAFSDYHALQIELRRRLSKGLSASGSYQFAHENGSVFDGFTFGREMVPSANVRHAIKTQWDYLIPVGRGQRFGTNWNAWMDGFLGGWSFKGVGRFQTRMLNLGNVRLVGMTHEELQSMYKFRHVKDPALNNGLDTVLMLPDDVILNTRRAFNTASNTVDGYSTALGAPTGRYIAPANYDGCIQVRAGDCAPRTTLLRAPWFVRTDVGLSKRVGLKGRSNIEVAIEVLNLLDNINFTAAANPGTNANIFQTTTIYQDTDNTYDPGGRLGQLMFRINW